jgi:hypothetical protein
LFQIVANTTKNFSTLSNAKREEMLVQRATIVMSSEMRHFIDLYGGDPQKFARNEIFKTLKSPQRMVELALMFASYPSTDIESKTKANSNNSTMRASDDFFSESRRPAEIKEEISKRVSLSLLDPTDVSIALSKATDNFILERNNASTSSQKKWGRQPKGVSSKSRGGRRIFYGKQDANEYIRKLDAPNSLFRIRVVMPLWDAGTLPKYYEVLLAAQYFAARSRPKLADEIQKLIRAYTDEDEGVKEMTEELAKLSDDEILEKASRDAQEMGLQLALGSQTFCARQLHASLIRNPLLNALEHYLHLEAQ